MNIIRSQPPHVSTEEYRVTHHVMETMKEEMPTIVRSMVIIVIFPNPKILPSVCPCPKGAKDKVKRPYASSFTIIYLNLLYIFNLLYNFTHLYI